MEQLFTWSDEYSVGDATIDQQHQQIFHLGNTMAVSDTDEVNAVILQLYKYVRLHFSHEEEHMKKIGYPSLKEHCELHNALIDDLNTITSKPLNDEIHLKEFQTFIYYWVMDHVLKHDRKYFLFANKSKD